VPAWQVEKKARRKSEGDMKAERRSAKRSGFSCVVAAVLTLAFLCPNGKGASQWRLIPVEVDGTKDAPVADFALGAEGTPWVALAQAWGAICYRQDGRWHKLPGLFSLDAHEAQLQVAPTGRVYLYQPAVNRSSFPSPPAREGYARRRLPSQPRFGALYLLHDKRAEYVTQYSCDVWCCPPLFFDSMGRIWNWGNRFLGKFENGRWEKVEADIEPDAQVIEDAKGDLYFLGKTLSCWRDGRLTRNAGPLSLPWEQAELRACLWGTDKAFLFARSLPGAMAIDLHTLTASDVLHGEPLSQSAIDELLAREPRGPERAWESVPVLARSTLRDAFRDREGNVWVLAGGPTYRGYRFLKVCAADHRVEERVETAAIDWGDDLDSRPKPVLCARDGTLYFGTRRNGVYLYRGGILTHVGWKQGLGINETNWIREHPDGTIWFASRRTGIAVYDPCGVPGPEPASAFGTSWEEHALARSMLLRDFQGHLWCCRSDQPGRISRWDGRTWEHFDLGCDTTSLQILFVDNLHRLHFVVLVDHRALAYRRAGGRVERFSSFLEMLTDSVRTGAREFRDGGPYPWPAPLVLGEQGIWCRDAQTMHLMRYDGQAWHEVRGGPSQVSLFRHQDDQVLMSDGRTFEILDRGQIIPFTSEHMRHREYLLGEGGFQPFEADVYERHQGELFPVRKTEDAIYVLEYPSAFAGFAQDSIPPQAVKLPSHIRRIWPAEGGFYACTGAGQLLRYYRGLLLTISLVATPLTANCPEYEFDACEDASGALWMRRGGTLFRVKRPQLETRITAPQTPECTSPGARITFTGTSTDGAPLSYAWRLDGAPWSQPADQPYADVEFTRPGSHTFEVTSVGPLGNLDTTPAVLTLNVIWALPEVRIVSAPQETVTDLDVAVTYEVVKRSEGSRLVFQWRLDGGTWHGTRETTIRPAGLADGEHLFEVRAVEDNRYVQEPPAATKFTVRVDYEEAIRAAIKKLHSRDYEQREAAVARLVALGERCRPYLEKELESADEDTQWWIRAALGQIDK
jgi:hypothetical protein